MGKRKGIEMKTFPPFSVFFSSYLLGDAQSSAMVPHLLSRKPFDHPRSRSHALSFSSPSALQNRDKKKKKKKKKEEEDEDKDVVVVDVSSRSVRWGDLNQSLGPQDSPDPFAPPSSSSSSSSSSSVVSDVSPLLSSSPPPPQYQISDRLEGEIEKRNKRKRAQSQRRKSVDPVAYLQSNPSNEEKFEMFGTNGIFGDVPEVSHPDYPDPSKQYTFQGRM